MPMDASREQFGDERLASVLARGCDSGLEESLDAVVQEVATWRGDEHFSDDISILAAERLEP